MKEGENITKIVDNKSVVLEVELKKLAFNFLEKNKLVLSLNDFQIQQAKIKFLFVNSIEIQFKENNFANNYITENDICKFEIIVPESGEIENFQEKFLYKGFFKKGKPNGKGFKIDPKEKTLVWTGIWKDGKEWKGSGSCVFIDEYNDTFDYYGELKKGKPNNKGKKVSIQDKETWEGIFKEGKEWKGEGVTKFKDNLGNIWKFDGSISKGIPSFGSKINCQTKEIIWEGEWENGKEWKGKGTIEFIEEEKSWLYSGEILEGKPNNYGKKLDQKTKEVIWEGDWIKGREYNGKGTSNFIEIDRVYTFKGELLQGRPNGFGSKYFEDNLEWEGDWKNGKEWNGRGLSNFIDKEGNIWIYNGILINGLPVEGKHVLNNFLNDSKLKANFSNGKLSGSGLLFENKKEYFVEFDQNGNEIKEERKRTFEGVRLMIVGNENVGKTSFKIRLMGCSNIKDNQYACNKINFSKKEEDMTHGVDIQCWKDEKNQTLFSIWDFAGHEEYHAAHSFFFSSGCVYLILFDISFDPLEIISKNKLLYWLHFLQTQVGTNSRFILVASKYDLLFKQYTSMFGIVDMEKLKDRVFLVDRGTKF